VASAGQAECKEVTDQERERERERERMKREERIEPGGDRRTTRLQDRGRKK